MDRKTLEEKTAAIAEKLTERQATYLEGYVAGVAAILQHAEPADQAEAEKAGA